MQKRPFIRQPVITISALQNENSLKTLRKRTKMNLIRNFRNWRRYRETVNELSRLSNRELNDLGITRAEIHGIARGAR